MRLSPFLAAMLAAQSAFAWQDVKHGKKLPARQYFLYGTPVEAGQTVAWTVGADKPVECAVYTDQGVLVGSSTQHDKTCAMAFRTDRATVYYFAVFNVNDKPMTYMVAARAQ